MNQTELNRQVARVTGETVATVAERGFVPLCPVPQERDREPLAMDWDDWEASREVLHPV